MSDTDRRNPPEVGAEGTAVAADEVVRFCGGPSLCMDDLCRNSSVGLCGLTDADCSEDEEDDDDPWCDECGRVSYECHCDYSLLSDGTVR